ncbi:MAG: transcriptional repressor [Syntrophaceae bacterium]|nr:transcriptional repressor [Syntrophaceae bacterium]
MITIRKKSDQIIGRPTTNQRSLLLEVIKKANKHLDADELYRLAKKRNKRISLATVYRNLKLFKDLGLISESNLGETHSHYEIKEAAEHHHLVCLSCGRIIEFNSPLVAKAVKIIQRNNNFYITSVQLKMEGYCSRCKNDKK